MNSIQHVTFGLILDDIVQYDGTTFMETLGGGGPQTAWGMAAALGDGASVGLVAGVGGDLNPDLLAPLQAAQINLEGLRITRHPTPRAWQVTEKDGRRTQVWRTPTAILGDQLAKQWDVLPSAYHEAHAFHWGIHVEDDPPLFAHSLHSLGRYVSLEPFRPPSQPLISVDRQAIYRTCSIFSATQGELEAMLNGATSLRSELEVFRAMGGEYWVIRKGANGAMVYEMASGQSWSAPAYPVEVVDTIGAGNAFCGAFLARIHDGPQVALCHALVAASYMIQQVGLPAHLPAPQDYQQRWEGLWKQMLGQAF
jgi:sugar/nucleoside kinase (ribokinase family)